VPPAPVEAVPQTIEGCAEFGPAPGIPMPGGLGDISKIIGLRNADGSINSSLVSPDSGPIASAVANTLMGIITTGLDQIAKVGNSILSQSGCASGQQLSLIASSIVLNLLRNFVGDSLDGMRVPNQQQRNYLCPTALPSAEEALASYMGNTIDKATLECWIRACGIRFPEYEKSVEARRTKLNAQQLGILFMRDLLSEEDFKTRIREGGMLHENDANDILNLLKLIPPASDLTRFMVRDVADEQLVIDFGMDDDFTKKFSGQVKDWAQQQGMSREYMQSVWRAHWTIPPPTQLFEMLHRNSRLDPSDRAYVDIAMVRKALEQQDILPFWIDKILEISYRPLTRVDAQRAYRNGTLTEDALLEAYLNLGYNLEDAGTLTAFNTKQIRLSYRKLPAVRDYSQGYINDAEFVELMTVAGADDVAIDDARSAAKIMRSKDKRKRCVNALHKRFVKGDIDNEAVTLALDALGITGDTVLDLVTGWQCERDSAGRAIPAGELCSLYGQGAIDAPGLTGRLQNLGYSYENAVLLTRRCATTTNQRITASEQRSLRQQESDARREDAATNRAIQKAITATAKQQRAALSMQKANVQREKRLIEAGNTFAKTQQSNLSDAVLAVKSIYRGMLNSSAYLPDEIIAALITAVKSPDATSLNNLTKIVQLILAS
jgi:hypothetical protein